MPRMSCYRCHTRMVESVLSTKIMAGDHLVTVEDVPCFLCPDCGAASFNGQMLMAIEEVLETGPPTGRAGHPAAGTVSFPDIADKVSKVEVGKIVLHSI